MFDARPGHPESTKLSRRTLAKGAAWSVPAVAVAGAAPAYAASRTLSGGLCYTNESTASGGLVPRRWYFWVGTSDGSVIKQGDTWTFVVTFKWTNLSDYNANPNPLNANSYGSFSVTSSPSCQNPATFTRSFTVTVRANDSVYATGASCTPYAGTTTIKADTQVTIQSTDGGSKTYQTVYSNGAGTYGCYATGSGVPSTPPNSTCCNYGSRFSNPALPCANVSC